MSKKQQKRDYNKELFARREIDLRTKSVPDKTKYSRKTKHKNKEH